MYPGPQPRGSRSQAEPREPPVRRAVERGDVLLAGLLVERRRVGVPQLRELLGAPLDGVLVVAVRLLGLVARGAVVRSSASSQAASSSASRRANRSSCREMASAKRRRRSTGPSSTRACSSVAGTSSTATRPRRAARLPEGMVRLASADRPDVLCLQEVPVWALPRLGEWSGMQVFGDVAPRPGSWRGARRADHGDRPWAVPLGPDRPGQRDPARTRAPGARAESIVLNPRGFRKAQARWLGFDLRARLAWAKERRICNAVRVETDGRYVSSRGCTRPAPTADAPTPSCCARPASRTSSRSPATSSCWPAIST